MKKSEKYEKQILNHALKLDESFTPEEKEAHWKEFHELNRKKNIEIQKELLREVNPEQYSFFGKLAVGISNIPSSIRRKIHDLFQKQVENIYDKIDTSYYNALEDNVDRLLEHPESIPQFIRSYQGNLCNLFNCSGKLSRLEEMIDLNLEKDFRLITGADLTLELKESFRKLFTEHRQVIHNTITELIEKGRKSAWENIHRLDAEKVPELVDVEISGYSDEERIRKFIEVYCKILQNRKLIDGTPQNLDEAYEELSFNLYRSLKIELDNGGVWDKKMYVNDLNFEDSDIQPVWEQLKVKILQKMEFDSYLG